MCISGFRAHVFSMLVLVALDISASCAQAASCENLRSTALTNGAVLSVVVVAAGDPSTPGDGPDGGTAALMSVPQKDLPAFCRIAATLKPSPDSDIKIEIWLPAAGWNGKFMAVGNGGWAGQISYASMRSPLARGFATASTDTGHSGSPVDASFAAGHPEKLIDFDYRSVHEMTLAAKNLIQAFYGQAPKFSYWFGCSTGGRQALMEAQRFPQDFDGIISGAPANYMTHTMAEHVWVAQAVRKADGSAIPAQKYALIHEAVLQTCDARDGVKDGVLEDPRMCKFNPRQLQCNDASNASCLTRDQVKAAEAIYNPLVDSHTKRQIFPGLMPGSELGWNALAGPDPGPIAITYWRDLVFADPQWNYLTVDVSAATAKADAMHAAAMNAINPDLTEFFQHGGKLVQYHGWNDEQISPLNTVQYYESVVKKLGSASVEHSYRLFMIPGMAHCRGGEGVNSFDSISIIDNWVANANPPAQIPASRVRDGKVEGTRPVCSYPRVAVYKGTGNTDDARNFTCEQR